MDCAVAVCPPPSILHPDRSSVLGLHPQMSRPSITSSAPISSSSSIPQSLCPPSSSSSDPKSSTSDSQTPDSESATNPSPDAPSDVSSRTTVDDSAQSCLQPPSVGHTMTSSFAPRSSLFILKALDSFVEPRDWDTPSPVVITSITHLLELSSQSQTPLLALKSVYDISSIPISDVIELVAAFLTKITACNDLQTGSPDALESAGADRLRQLNDRFLNSSVLAFHGKTVPSISILQYLHRIQKYCPTSAEVFIGLLVYFDRMADRINILPRPRPTPSSSSSFSRPRADSSSHHEVAPSSDHLSDVTPSSVEETQPETDEPMADVVSADKDLETVSSSGSPAAADTTNFRHSTTTHDQAGPDCTTDGGSIDDIKFIVNSFNIHRLIISGVTCASKFFSDIFYTNSRYAKVGGLPLPELNRLEVQFLSLNDFRLTISMTEMRQYGTLLVESYIHDTFSQPRGQSKY